jgi:Fic family protein
MPTTALLERQHASTHPWINFRLDLHGLSYKTWLLLGEAESKCTHVAGVPLAPAVAATLHQVYITKGVHGTASIEGNTLSEDEVRQRIAGDLDLPVSREYLGREIDNIVEVCNEIVERMMNGTTTGLSVDLIKEYNRRVLEGLPRREDVTPGVTRTHSVTVGLSSYRGAPAEDCDYLLEKLVSWLDSLKAPEDKPELRFPIAVLKSVVAHLYLAWIHPFGDGNGRTARLIEFQLMIEAGAPLPAAHLLSDHYNRTRDAYLIELDRTSRAEGFPIEGFIQYALQGFVDELREQIQTIREQQYEVTWVNYVHELYQHEDTHAKRRQLHLILDFPANTVVPRSKIREVSMRMANEYSGSTAKTLTRDLNELERRGLLVRRPGGYAANRDLIAAFLPVKIDV